MKRMKLLVLLFIVIILTGCDVNYDLLVTDNKKVLETVTFVGDNQSILKGNDSVNVYIDNQIKAYKGLDIFERYGFTKQIGEANSSMTMKRTYQTLKEYADSPLFKQLFETASVITNSETSSFTTIGSYYYASLFGEGGKDPSYTINLIKVRIKFYNEMVECNADIKNTKSNIYEWHITSSNIDKSISFKINNNKRYDVMIMDFISNNILNFIVIGVVIAIIIVAGIYISFRFKRSNNI